jgi:hypothetical protein
MSQRDFSMTATPTYFVNGWVDGAMIGGLSLITWLAFALLFGHGDAKPLEKAALGLSFLFNFPHFSATVYRLYQKTDNIKQFPITSCGLPIAIFAGIIASILEPQLVAPYFLLLYLLWSPYHYSGQTVGITMVYARRCGFPIGQRERLALSGFVFATFLCMVARIAAVGPLDFYGMPVPPIFFPKWLLWGVVAVMAASGVAFAGFAVRWCLNEKRLLPPIILLPAIAQFVWFVPGAGLKAFVYFVPLFHSMQYLLIAAVMQLSLRLHDAEGERSWRRIGRETLRWGWRNVAGGAVLFIAVPWLFAWAPLPLMSLAGIIAAAINIHHFFVDGVIWKLRDPVTAAALRVNVAEFAGPPVGLAPALAKAS